MVRSTQLISLSALVGALPFLIGSTNAQNAPTPSLNYPEWWTNDYSCVIQCMQNTFNGQTPPATQDQQNTSLGCVSSTCNNATAAANYYQGTYIIRMFNAKGSIYEEGDLAADSQPSATPSSSDSSDSSDTDTSGPTPTDSSATTLTASVGAAADADATSTTDFDAPAGAPTGGSSKNSSAPHSAGASNGTSSGAAGRVSGNGMDVRGLTGLALAIALGVGASVAFGL